MTLTLFAVTAVPFSAAETADTGTTLIDFESNGGWSGTNCDSGMLEKDIRTWQYLKPYNEPFNEK